MIYSPDFWKGRIWLFCLLFKRIIWLLVSFVYFLQCLLTPSSSLSTRLLIQRWEKSKLIKVFVFVSCLPSNVQMCSAVLLACVCALFWLCCLCTFQPQNIQHHCAFMLSSWFDLLLSSHWCLMLTIMLTAPVDVSPPPPPLPLGFVTLTTSRGSAGAQYWALSLTVIINNLEP